MQFEVRDLIDKIKKDGLEEANKTSEEIILSAQKEKENIIEKAKQEAQSLKDKAKKESDDYQRHALETTKQAVRDLVLGTELGIRDLFKRTLQDEVSTILDVNFLSHLISNLVNTWLKDENLEIYVGKGDIDALKSLLKNKISAKLNSGIQLQPFSGSQKGFKIQKKGSNLYFDFSSDTISDILFDYLNPKFKIVVSNK